MTKDKKGVLQVCIYHCGRRVLSGRMRERLQDERRGFADHCRVDATGDRVHALPETTTRLAFAESRAADSPHAICDGSNRTQVPGDITCTSPHAKHRRYGPLRSRPRRSRPASALPSKFRRRGRRPGRGSDGPQRAATRPVRSASVRGLERRGLERIFISGFVRLSVSSGWDVK